MGWFNVAGGQVVHEDHMNMAVDQGILIFTNATQRNSQMAGKPLKDGMTSYLQDTKRVERVDGGVWKNATPLIDAGTGNITSFTSDVSITLPSGQSSSLFLNGIGTGYGEIVWQKDGKGRWTISATGTESGADTGSDLKITNRHDDGSAITIPVWITRATGLVRVLGDPVEPTGVATKGYVDPAAWTALPLQGAWVGYGSTFEMPRYTKYGNGVVRLQGLVKSGTTNPVAILPAGFRPSATLYFPSVRDMHVYSTLAVKSDGAVEMLPAPSGAVGWFSVNATFQT